MGILDDTLFVSSVALMTRGVHVVCGNYHNPNEMHAEVLNRNKDPK